VFVTTDPVTGSTELPSIEAINASIAAGFAILVPVVTNGGNVVTAGGVVGVAVVVPSRVLDVSETYGLYPASLGACATMSGFIAACRNWSV
jgi:hypothetical protein